MKIATAQYPLFQHKSIRDWMNYVDFWVKLAVEKEAELLLFPEYGSYELLSLFDEDLSLLNTKAKFKRIQEFLPLFKNTFIELANKYNVIIVAPSFLELVDDLLYNKVYVFNKNGIVGYQDKLLRTKNEFENWDLQIPPPQLTVFETNDCTFGIQICYDSEFAVGPHLLAENGIDLLLIPSCTETAKGASRIHIGARARAMEQQMYVVVSQLVSNAEWTTLLNNNFGYAAIYTPPDIAFPDDGILRIGTAQTRGWLVQDLDFSNIKSVRQNGQTLNFKDHRTIEMQLKNNAITVKKIKL